MPWINDEDNPLCSIVRCGHCMQPLPSDDAHQHPDCCSHDLCGECYQRMQASNAEADETAPE